MRAADAHHRRILRAAATATVDPVHFARNVGQRWYGFGWESLLLESGFLTIFLCPLRPAGRFPTCLPPPTVVIWAFRWLLFRVMLGAGLIKYRGDRCWRPAAGDPSAMDFFYETQPVPNPLSRALHRAPRAWHRFETFVGLWVVELLSPILLLLPGMPASPGPLGVLGHLRTGTALLQVGHKVQRQRQRGTVREAQAERHRQRGTVREAQAQTQTQTQTPTQA